MPEILPLFGRLCYTYNCSWVRNKETVRKRRTE